MMKLDKVRATLVLAIVITSCPGIYSQDYITMSAGDLPKAKRTSLELYITAAQAYDMWKSDSANVKILDVRTLEEYIFVGHGHMAVNIALANQTCKWDLKKEIFTIEPNPDFINLVKEWSELDDLILVMCRSGGRSAMAVNLMADAGFTHAYNIIDGMEGDLVKDPESVYLGKRMKNGWKNSGNPWTYQVNPEKVKITDK